MVNLDFNIIEYVQMLEDAHHELEQEKKELEQEKKKLEGEHEKYELKTERVKWAKQCFEAARDLFNENKKLLEEIESLQKQLDEKKQQVIEEREQKAELEMKLTEMKKISEVMAKKASEEAVLKALRTYANTSKRKTVDKRAFAKTSILEIANANGLVLPQEFAASIESLDDERPEPKVMNVSGNYNDIHDNATVNQK